MEEGNVSEETELGGEVSSNVPMVEVDSCNDIDRRVVQGRCAEDPIVGTDVGADPVKGEVVWVRVDGFLPSLESYVGSL